MNSINKSFKIKGISVKNLFGFRNCEFLFKQNPNITILYGVNGSGKTTILRIIQTILTFNFFESEKFSFKSFKFILPNKKSIEYSKGNNKNQTKIVFINETGEKEEWSLFPPIIDPRTRRRSVQLIAYYTYLASLSKGREDELKKIVLETEDYDQFYDFIEEISPMGFEISPRELFRRLKNYFTEENIPVPPWFIKFTEDNPLDLIASERLTTIKEKGRRYDRKIVYSRVINTYTNELTSLKKDALDVFNLISLSLNTTFPQRVINILKDPLASVLNSIEIDKKLRLLRQKEANIISKGLLKREYIKEPPLDKESLEKDEIAKVISLWLNDTNEKYLTFDKLMNKIEIFENILNNDHLNDKKIKFDIDQGFYFECEKSNQKLEGDQLSSGEQHAVVLFYHLIFKAKEDSIVLIDEPEISFHVLWQNKFIDHIIKIGKNNNLSFLLATHSPEIIYGRLNLIVKLE